MNSQQYKAEPSNFNSFYDSRTWFKKIKETSGISLYQQKCNQILRDVACRCIDYMTDIFSAMWVLTTTIQKYFQSQLIILILDQINKWINCTVKKNHNDTKFEINPIPVSAISQIIHEIVNLIINPTDEEGYANHQEGFNSISPCEPKCVVYLQIITGIISLRIV